MESANHTKRLKTLKDLSNIELVKMSKEFTQEPTRWRLGYQHSDDRTISSGIDDMPDGDNFADFTKDYFEMYEDELFD